MKTLLINYADRGFSRSQKLNTESGLKIGGFDRVFEFGSQHLSPGFCSRNRHILDARAGAGWWIWKPYIVLQALHHVLEGDIVFYCDCDAQFIRPVAPVIEFCLRNADLPILLFRLDPTYTNRRFTKRDCFILMGLDSPPYAGAVQTLSGYFVCRKTLFTLEFVEEWLRFAEDERILTAMPNECGLPDYPDFFQHRADQSILSLLGCKYHIPSLGDISQWGNSYREAHIPQIIYLSTNRD